MYKAILIIILIFGSMRSFSQDTVYWDAKNKLRWEFFEGIPDTTLNYLALTSSGIACEYLFTDSSFSYKARSFFNKKKSWKMDEADDYTLQHEQLHFDITEFFARELRKRLSVFKPIRTTVKEAFNDILEKVLIEKNRMQDKYDDETDFGRLPEVQEVWRKRLSCLLSM